VWWARDRRTCSHAGGGDGGRRRGVDSGGGDGGDGCRGDGVMRRRF